MSYEFGDTKAVAVCPEGKVLKADESGRSCRKLSFMQRTVDAIKP